MAKQSVTIPQLNEDQRKKLAKLVEEGCNSMLRQDAEKEHMKEIRARAKDELNIPTKIFNKVVRIAHEHSGDEYDSETESVLTLAEQAGFYRSDDA